MADSNVIYTWTFDDRKNRSPVWYISAISIVIGFALWGFLTKQYGMSFVVLLVAGVAFFVENNSDEHINVTLTNLWMKVWDKFYDYSRIESYALIYDHENALFLRLNLSQRGIKRLDLKINNAIAADLKEILPHYIQENPKQEITLTDRIIYLLKL